MDGSLRIFQRYWGDTNGVLNPVYEGIITFWASEYFGSPGFARGLNLTTPTSEFFFTLITGDARSRFFPMYSLGNFQITWAAVYIIGAPIGAAISANILKEFIWKTPRDAKELLTVFGDSILMGFGAATAGGCFVNPSGSCVYYFSLSNSFLK